MMKGNEKDCICAKEKGKHTKRCDAYRLSEFLIAAASIKSREPSPNNKNHEHNRL